MSPFDAIVLAGGRATRLDGADKPEVALHGRALVDHVLDAVSDAHTRVIVGPQSLVRAGVITVREDPPFGGPAAGIAAGMAALERDEPRATVAVLACDIPRSGALVTRLIAALDAHPDADGAQAVRPDGSPQPLAALYRRDALVAAIAAAQPVRGMSVRKLLAPLNVIGVDDPDLSSWDVDTWDDLERISREPEVPS